MNEASFAEYVPLWRTLREEGVTALVTPALDYVGALELGPLDARFADEAAIAACGEGLRSLLASIEEECTLHFLYRVCSDVEEDVRAYEDVHAGASSNPALERFVAARAAWLREQPLRAARVFLFYSARPGRSSLARGHLGAKVLFASLARHSAEEHQRQLRGLAALRNALGARLAQVGISTRELSEEEVRGLYHQLLNPTHAARRWPAPKVAVRDTLWDERTVRAEGEELREYTEAEQLLAEDLVEERGHLRQEAVFRRALTLKTLPEAGTCYLAAEPLLALATRAADGAVPFPYWLSVAVTVQPQGKAKWLLSAQHGLVEALRTAIPFLADKSVAKEAADAAKQRGISALFEELNAMASRLVRLSVSLLLEADSLEALDERTEAARAAFARAGNSELLLEEVTQLPAFLAMLPGSGPYQLRTKQCTSRNAADFLPVFVPWRGTARATSLLFTPSWDVFRLDLLDGQLASANHGVVGADTGSGKSLTLGALTLDAVAAGVDAILIDNGGSWEPMTRLLGGVHVPVELGTAITPFRPWAEMVGADGALDAEAVQDVVTYLELCTREDGESGFDRLTLQLVARAVRTVYEGHFRQAPQERPLMSAFREAVKAHGAQAEHPEDKAICERLYRRLGLFVGDALYGPFLDRPSALRFDARVLTFDMAGVSKSPVTRSIAMATVMQAIAARASRKGGRRTLVEVDEGHVYLGQDATAERFLERCYRVMRKHGVAMWMVSQHLADFLQSRAGTAIVANSPLKLFLRHASGHAAIAEQFQLSPRAAAAFRALDFSKGRYSDFLLLYGPRTATVRLAPHPLAYWVLTTDVADKQLLERAAEKNPALPRLTLLEHLAREYPHGASGPRRAARPRSVSPLAAPPEAA